MKLTDFHYDLPKERIARYPLVKRSASRLLCLNKKTGAIEHGHFTDLLHNLSANDLLIANNTKVIPARFFGQKVTGGQVEVLVERIIDPQHLLVHLRASKKPQPGSELLFAKGIRLHMVRRRQDLFELRFDGPGTVLEVIEAIGQIPLPHYMERESEPDDQERYQTIYAEHKGSVAAPTAGLHFDHEFLTALKIKKIELDYVTLHVGAGTFAPVRVDNIVEHQMHAEYMQVTSALCEKIKEKKALGGRIIAIGTTSARCLETACRNGHLQAFQGETSLFIYPGYTFQCVDALITNFHLPSSTLLMLVAALGGHAEVMNAYREAVATGYRFFSYGDAMWIA